MLISTDRILVLRSGGTNSTEIRMLFYVELTGLGTAIGV